jgi:tRNA G18 (ribose-2'-O)-methylase SpoU
MGRSSLPLTIMRRHGTMPAVVVRHLDEIDAVLLSDYRNVPDPELLARRGLFVAEGRLVVVRRLLTTSRLAVRSVLVTETAFAALRDALEPHADLPVYIVPPPVMNAVTGFNIHRGCLALGVRPPRADWRAVAREAQRLVILERVGDADNVGSIVRSAAAFGAEAVLLGPACADPFYRKAIRTSMGTALSTRFAAIEPWPGALCELRGGGVVVVGLTPSADATLREVAEQIAGRCVAIVVGHEGDGMTADAAAACEYRARIPMASGVDSLNVATAAAVALYELTAR